MTSVDKPYTERKDGEGPDRPVMISLNKIVIGEPDQQHNLTTEQIKDMQTITLATVASETSTDEELALIKTALQSDHWPLGLEAYQAFGDEISEDPSGVILRNTRIILPKTLRQKALEIAHRGHSGASTMKATLRDRMWWPKLGSEVDLHCSGCLACVAMQKHNPPEPMTRTKLPQRPWDYLALDYFSAKPLKESVLVITDYYSRFVQARVVAHADLEHTIKELDELFALLGLPGKLKTDNGPPFSADAFEAWCCCRGIKTVKSTPLWPQQNGQVEESNKGIKRALTAAVINKQPLKEALKEYTRAYNDRVHSVTGKTPRALLLGREPNTALPSLAQSHWLQEDDDDLRDRDAQQKLKGKLTGDKRRRARDSSIEIGDLVMIQASGLAKLTPRFKPTPYRVVNRSEENVVVEPVDGQGATLTRNVALLKRFPYKANQAGGTPSPEQEEEERQPKRPKRNIVAPKRYGVDKLEATTEELPTEKEGAEDQL